MDKTNISTEDSSDGFDAYISVKSTKAFPDKNVLTENEYKIKRYRIMIFNGDGSKLEKIIKYDTTATFSDGVLRVHIPFSLSEKGNVICTIINEPDNLIEQLDNIKDTLSLAVVKYKLTDFLPKIAHKIENGEIKSKDDFCVPFYGSIFINTGTNIPDGQPAPIIMYVERVVARVDIFVNRTSVLKTDVFISDSSYLDIIQMAKEGFISSYWEEIYNRAGKLKWNITKPPLPQMYDTLGVENGPNPSFIVPLAQGDNNVHIYSFYAPEFSVATSSNFGFVLRDVDITDGRKKSYRIVIGTTKLLTKIRRNTVYKIYCSLDDSEFPIEVYYSKWGEDNLNVPI